MVKTFLQIFLPIKITNLIKLNLLSGNEFWRDLIAISFLGLLGYFEIQWDILGFCPEKHFLKSKSK